ncbi:MAG: ribokinase [Hyphomicrobiaceae bacterium]
MITVFGSIGMDLLFSLPHLPAVGETVLTPAYATAMGGKGANQAVAAARDGGRVRFVGSAGADGFGNEVGSLLRAEGIDLAGLSTVDAATCMASIWFDTQGRNQIAVASGANLLTRAEALRPDMLAPGDWLVLQMEIPSGEVSKAVALAKARNARVILNLAPALPIEEAALRQADVLVLNEHEASQLCTQVGLASGAPAKLAGPISRLLGPSVIVTLGPDGAVGAKGNQIWHAQSVPVKAVDTTGAGDCFVGVLAAAMDRGLEMQPAMRRACVAASMACTLVGAAPSFPAAAAIDLILGET